MPYIKLEDFSGIVPRTGPTQIDATQAQTANNVKLQSRELRSWSAPLVVYTPSSPNTQTIYRIESPGGEKYWLEWTSNVDMVPGPVADVDEFRYYYTGDGIPKKTNYALATNNGSQTKPYPKAWLNMGVAAPTNAPTLAASGTSEPVETRAYVYTNISTFGSVKEESAPSPPSTVTVSLTNATVTISGFTAIPTNGYNITSRRIYRTITGATSVVFAFVAEIANDVLSYVDGKSVTQLGSELPSLYWGEPPEDLQGLVAMPNGILAGFVGNQVWFSEPYYPHAWPPGYSLTVDDPIVGLGVYQTTLVVATARYPYLISGVSPTSMSQQKLPIPQPCVSKKSIVSDQYGVLYASPNGLVSLGSGTQDVVTTPLYTRDEWQLLNPATMLSLVYNNLYIGFYTASGGTQAIVIARGEIPPLVTLEFDAQAVFVDRTTADIFAISKTDEKLYQLDASPVNYLPYEWLSKQFIMPSPTNFAAMKVQADFSFMDDANAYREYVNALILKNIILFAELGGKIGGSLDDEALNVFAVNGSKLYDIPEQADFRTVTVIVYADGKQIFAKDVISQEPFRMPADVKAYIYEILVAGNTPVRSVIMASSINELRQVTT